MFSIVDEVDIDLQHSRLYEHGWQSWSPTATYHLTQRSSRPDVGWQQVMRFRPETSPPPEGFQAEGLMVLDPGTGAPLRVYSAPDPSVRVPSIRAELVGNRVLVTADGPISTEVSAVSMEAALARFGDDCAGRLGAEPPRAAPTAWCSWYHYYLDVTEADVIENLDAIVDRDLPVDVIQIDDGWQAGVGDWLQLSDRFTSLAELALRIHDGGRRAGIWLAPFTATAGSLLAREHPDWLAGAAGWNWDQDLYGLDLTHPGVRGYLREVFSRLSAAGFDYFKLDFLYSGALPGRRHDEMTAVSGYRSGLELIRDSIGPDGYLLGCGAPILPSVGLVDAMRIGPDTDNPNFSEPGSAALRGELATVSRAWQHGRFWVNDADCLIARPSFVSRQQWAAAIDRYGGLRSFSDRIVDLDEWGLRTIRRLLSTVPPPTPFPAADRLDAMASTGFRDTAERAGQSGRGG